MFVTSMLSVRWKTSLSLLAVTTLCVSDAHNFTADPSSACDYGYHAYGELARFPYYLLQKQQDYALSTPDWEMRGFHSSQSFTHPSN